MSLEKKMNNLTASIDCAVKEKNYYAALTLALTLPDICSKIEYPAERNTEKRYVRWFDDFLAEKYKKKIGMDLQESVFLSGQDLYALRCSYLHQGESDITNQRARKVLTNFVFIVPTGGGMMHLNMFNDILQIQTDIFCKDVSESVKKWIDKYKNNIAMNKKAEKILEIKFTSSIEIDF